MSEEMKELVEVRRNSENYAYQGLVLSLVLVCLAPSKDLKLAGLGLLEGGLHNGYIAAYGGAVVAFAFARFYMSFLEARKLRELLVEQMKNEPTNELRLFMLREVFGSRLWATCLFVTYAGIQILFLAWLLWFFSTPDGKSITGYRMLTDFGGIRAKWKFQAGLLYLNMPWHLFVQIALSALMFCAACFEIGRLWLTPKTLSSSSEKRDRATRLPAKRAK